MNTFLTISDVAKTLNVSVDTIRRWEKRGLIKAKRSKLNYRLFNTEEVQNIRDRINGNHETHNYKILKNNQKYIYNTIELFAGAGGMALGFENAGLNHILLTDWDKDAINTLKSNRPNWNVVKEDVQKMSFKNMKADVVVGGFPCQSFSYAGKKMGFEDARGTMFFEFARCVKEVKPKIAIGENVKGLLRHDNGKTLNTIISILEELGYDVAYRVLKSQYFDVPQKRERLVIIAKRKDVKSNFVFPKEKNYIIPLKEALRNCPDSLGQMYPEKKKKILEMVPQGGYWKDLPLKIQKEYMMSSFYMGGGKTGMARRLSWDEPSLTLTCAPAQKQTERCHPEETRPLKVREYARIQTFPDEWEFEGSITSQYRQIGNAVPVNLAYYIGKCVIAMLENKTEDLDLEVSKTQQNLF